MVYSFTWAPGGLHDRRRCAGFYRMPRDFDELKVALILSGAGAWAQKTHGLEDVAHLLTRLDPP
jgi:hypothetical protein